MRNFLSLILSLMFATMFCGCTFNQEEPKYMKYEDFCCCYVADAYAKNSITKKYATGVNILELVEEAKEKETIVIPETIDGLPVIAIGMGGLGWTLYLQGYYNKIYLPDSVLNIHDVGRSIHHRKVFLTDEYGSVDWDSRTTLLQNILLEFSDMQVFVAESLYQGYQTLSNIKNSECISIANLSYIVDNEIYWIDDYSNGEYINFPNQPIKQGYVFEGWYKDEGFLQEWVEEIDQYQKSEDSISVKLYAKFVIEEE